MSIVPQSSPGQRLAPPLIEFENVTIMRGDRVVLDSLHLTIGADEHVAILGPNGSGKSSLIKVITRECYPLLTPEGHTLRILGRDRWVVEDLRKLMGIVTNDLLQTCTQDYSAREIILSGFFSSIGVWPWHEVTGEMEKKADEILELLEIPHLADRNVTEMSSGEARRVVIGRALVHDPKSLILDEPTSSLDFRAYTEVRALLRKLADSGVTIVMVTHHLPDIIPEIDRLILLREGRIFGDGPKKEMLTREPLSQLFGVPVNVFQQDGYYNLC